MNILKKSISIVICIILCLVSTSATFEKQSNTESQSYNPSVGIWYSTWYAKEGVYKWIDGHGYGSVEQLVADVNGDGKDDAIVCFADGSWYIALSSGNGFGGYSCWKTQLGTSTVEFMSGDVNGDGKDDAIIWEPSGSWKVALSSGTAFGQTQIWRTNFGSSGQVAMLADVNGDNKDDAVIFTTSGKWEVALSNGSSFNSPTTWVEGHGSGSRSQMLGDVNGDGRDDAVVFFEAQGSWYVSLSSGNNFGAYSQWITGHGANSTKQFLADVNGNGSKDAVYYTSNGVTGADWYWARSTSTSFIMSETWKNRHGYGCTSQLVGNIFGDGKDAPIAYFADKGTWKALPADFHYVFPNIYNTWESGFHANNKPLDYIPYTLGQYQTYDSGDVAVIDEHLSMMAQAGIDYLLFDLTNHVNADNSYIKNRAITVARRIDVWNNNPNNRPIKYAVGIGYMQLTHSPQTMEEECAIVYNEFVNTAHGGAKNYYYENGKPLIVSYAEYNDRIFWEQSNISKAASNMFSVGWMQGILKNEGTVPSQDFGKYYGWSYPNGSLANSQTMVVMPGHNNQVGTFISRRYNNTNGGFYSQQCWQRVISQKPRNVVINSFNEFAEETAVQPCDTANLKSPSEKWYNQSNSLDPNMYWNMTKQFISQLRGS